MNLLNPPIQPALSGAGSAQEDGDEAIQSVRGRAALPLDPRERLAEGVGAVAFIVVCAAFAFLADSGQSLDPGLAVLLVVGYALATRIKFDVGTGYTNPTQLIFVPMLFLLPVEAVAALAAAANLIGELPEYLTRKRHPQRALTTLSDCWYAVGPVLVLMIASAGEPTLSDWPIYVAALAAQITFDFAGNAVRERFEYGLSPMSQSADSGWYLTIDVLLSSLGLFLAITIEAGTEVLLLVVPLMALFATFSYQRRSGLESARELSDAYRGTTLLLADVIEHDDFYTGSHSRGVVSLSLQVADEMGVSPQQRRNVEFAALLHDVGKLAVSKEIINKDGPLSKEEWALMKVHTLDGEKMLQRIGGLFDEVGTVVRSSHENWDGTGYPDGLAGVSIPLEARIVSCCDAFNAMTTNRSYRPAMTTGEALDELRRCAGGQFDPGVAWTLVRQIERSEIQRFDPMLRGTDQHAPASPSPPAELGDPPERAALN